jgi:hypothetical protein
MRSGGGLVRQAYGYGAIAVVLIATMSLAAAAQRNFTPAEIVQWDAKSFVGSTGYELVQRSGRPTVYAQCNEATSSGLFLREEIDLTQTPVLEWEWRVGNTYGAIDETVKAGDDYPARIYVVDEHPIFPWRTRALSYVWSSAMEEGADWPNAYADQVHMIAVDSGNDQTGTWQSYRRNLRQDFERYHGRDVENIDAIAIMSDCDDTGRDSEAWFGTIRLLE